MRPVGLRSLAAVAAAAASTSYGPFPGVSPATACENETQREYGKNAYAGYGRDRQYRDRVWDYFFNDGVRGAREVRERRLERTVMEEADAAAERLTISCEELLLAARTGLKLKRALRLMELTGQHDMVRPDNSLHLDIYHRRDYDDHTASLTYSRPLHSN
jgi:hypothetical protein